MRYIGRKLLALLAMQLALVSQAHSQYGLRDKDIEFSENWLAQVRTGVADDNLLAAAIVARQHDSALASDLLARALETQAHDPLLLATAVQSCFSEMPATACRDDSLFEELVQADHDNLEPHLYFMLRLVDNGNTGRALELLTEGMKAPRHSIYYFDKVEFLAQQLLSLGYPADELRYPASVYADSTLSYSLFLKVLATCTAQSAMNEEWKLGCLFLGARLQNRSKDLMAKVFGGAIQRDVLKAVGADQDLIDLVVEHNEWVGKMRDLANDKVDWLSTTSTALDEPESFIQDGRESTEFESLLRAIYRTQ